MGDRKNQILVLGDCMLDCYRIGVSYRNSPESPQCPVVSSPTHTYDAGGAANCAAWLSAQPENEVTLVGLTADDVTGKILRKRCREVHGIQCEFLTKPESETCFTTRKERVGITDMGKQSVRMLARMDWDCRRWLKEDEFVWFRDFLTGHATLNTFDLIVAVDYQKGVFRGDRGEALRELLACSDVPLVVNAKNPAEWHGLPIDTLICNEKEAKEAWGTTDTAEPITCHRGNRAARLIITRGANGVSTSLFSPSLQLVTDSWPAHLGGISVKDVTGAGDAFTAGVAHQRITSLRNRLTVAASQNPFHLAQEVSEGQRWAAKCCTKLGCGAPTRGKAEEGVG